MKKKLQRTKLMLGANLDCLLRLFQGWCVTTIEVNGELALVAGTTGSLSEKTLRVRKVYYITDNPVHRLEFEHLLHEDTVYASQVGKR